MRRAARRLSEIERLPFELRARLDYWWRSRDWPDGPVTLNQKIRWRLAFDRNPLLTTIADKIAVRDYVAERVGRDVLTECYAIADDPAEIEFDALPREYVVKPNHGCGGMWFVTDEAPAEGRFPEEVWDLGMTRPESTDRARVVATARRWLASNYGREWLEWAYLDVTPRLMVEELLPFTNGSPPAEIKLFVFHGRARLIRVVSQRFTEPCANAFTPSWQPLDVSMEMPLADPAPTRPARLERMIEIAERLGEGLGFVRVDLYEVGDRVVFGELTNYPAAGRGKWDPDTIQHEMGSWWQLA